jgi:O-antigen ligase
MLEKIKFVAVMLFALTMMWSTALANVSLAVLLLCALFSYRSAFSFIRSQPTAIISLGFFTYALIRQLLGPLYAPSSGLSDLLPWLYLSLYWLIGWALSQHSKQWHWFLVLGLIGFFIRVATGFDLDGVKAGLFESTSFGFDYSRASILFALYAATALLGLAVWRNDIVSIHTSKYPTGTLGWGVLLVLIFEILVITNSRGTWLGTVAGFSVLALYGFNNKISWSRYALLASMLAALIAVNVSTISERVDAESSTYQSLVSGDLSKVPYSSAGLRIHMYNHGVNMGSIHPWLGWGAGSVPWLMKQSPDKNIQDFPHFHSGYIEVWLQFGLIGVLFFSSFVLLLLRKLYVGFYTNPELNKYRIFILSSIALAVVWNLFNVGLEHTDYRFYSFYMLGLASAVLNESLQKHS